MSARYTANEMSIAVGQPVQLRAGDLWIDCVVKDVKVSWGTNRLLIQPVAGDGTAWVELSSVRTMAATVAGRAWGSVEKEQEKLSWIKVQS